MKKTERIEIRVSEKEKQFLKNYSKKTNLSISIILRQLIKRLQEEVKNAETN